MMTPPGETRALVNGDTMPVVPSRISSNVTASPSYDESRPHIETMVYDAETDQLRRIRVSTRTVRTTPPMPPMRSSAMM
jgi:hypothetical protein